MGAIGLGASLLGGAGGQTPKQMAEDLAKKVITERQDTKRASFTETVQASLLTRTQKKGILEGLTTDEGQLLSKKAEFESILGKISESNIVQNKAVEQSRERPGRNASISRNILSRRPGLLG